MRKWIAGAAIALSCGSTAYAALQEEAVTYKDGDTVMKGFIVYDDGKQFNLPLAHDAAADKQSKAEASKFFREAFK